MTEGRLTKPGGVPVRNWYAARTRFGQELGVRDALDRKGVEHFIPTCQRENYRGKMKEHALIPCLVFLRATKTEACALKTDSGLPVNYLFDYIQHTMLTVPDKQMDDFRRVYEAGISEGGLVNEPLQVGDRVRVTRGALKDVEGNVLELQGKLYVVVGLLGCVYAKARVPRAYLERIL